MRDSQVRLASKSSSKAQLEALESDLRNRGILPQESTEGSGKILKHDQDATKRDINASRVQRLEQRIVELEAENKELRGKISRFSELSTVLTDLEDCRNDGTQGNQRSATR